MLLLALSLSHVLADSQEYCETEDYKDATTVCKKRVETMILWTISLVYSTGTCIN